MNTDSDPPSTRRRRRWRWWVLALLVVILVFVFRPRGREVTAARQVSHLLDSIHRRNTGSIDPSQIRDWLIRLPGFAGRFATALLGGKDEAFDPQEELKLLGLPAWSPLTNALVTHPDSGVRGAVADVLAELPDPRVIPTLMAAYVRETAPETRSSILRALHQLEAPATESLVLDAVEMNDSPRDLRQTALGLLPEYRTERAVTNLLRILNTETNAMTREELVARSSFGLDPRVRTNLISLVQQDPEPRVRVAALRALEGETGPELALIMAGVLRDDSDESVRITAAEMLGQMNGAAATGALLLAARGGSPQLREKVVAQLGERNLEDVKSTLLELLAQDQVASIRVAAAMALVRTGTAANDLNVTGGLLDALRKDSTAEVRAAAARALGGSRDPAVLPALERIIDERESELVQEAALRALGRQLGGRFDGKLLMLLDRPGTDAGPRAVAVQYLAVARSPAHRERFLKLMMEDADKRVREAAVVAVASVADDDAVHKIQLVVRRDSADEVRVEAVRVLGRLRRPESVPVLIEAVERDSNDAVRQSAAIALGTIRRMEAAGALRGVLKQRTTKELRLAAARALGRLGGQKQLETLLTLYRSEPRMRKDLLGVISGFRNPEAALLVKQTIEEGGRELLQIAIRASPDGAGSVSTARLIDLLRNSPDRGLREAAAAGLGEVLDLRARQALEAAGGDSSASVRAAVAWSLGHHHDLRSVPRVLGLLNDSDSNVQFAAASALAEIGATNSVRALKQAQAGAPKQARIAIASALAFLGSDAGDLTLRRAVESATDWECFLGIISLLQLNSPAARTWLATAEPQPEFRRVIDVGLKRGPGAAAADLLLTANEPESDWLYGDRRYFALRALGMLHDPATLGVIETFVSDPNLELRSAARVAAWRLREPAAATGR